MTTRSIAPRVWLIALLAVVVASGVQPGAALRATAQNGAKKPSAANYDFTSVTEFAEQTYKKAALPGAGLLVYKDGQVIYKNSLAPTTRPRRLPSPRPASGWRRR